MIRLGKKRLGNGPTIAAVVADRLGKADLTRAERTGADLVELRLDTLKKRDSGTLIKTLSEFRRTSNLPLLLTIRSKKEGGRYVVKDDERLRLFTELTPYVDGVDIELSSKKILKDVVKIARRSKKTVVVSFHDFKATPGASALAATVKKAREAGGQIVKVAAYAKGPEELRRLNSLLIAEEKAEKGMIVIAMGGGGKMSRVFFPLIGSLITYGSVTSSTAPGQMSVKEIKKELARYGA